MEADYGSFVMANFQSDLDQESSTAVKAEAVVVSQSQVLPAPSTPLVAPASGAPMTPLTTCSVVASHLPCTSDEPPITRTPSAPPASGAQMTSLTTCAAVESRLPCTSDEPPITTPLAPPASCTPVTSLTTYAAIESHLPCTPDEPPIPNTLSVAPASRAPMTAHTTRAAVESHLPCTPNEPSIPNTLSVAPAGRAPMTSLTTLAVVESRAPCTANEPLIAPSNPLPLPSSRFFTNPRSRSHRAHLPSNLLLAPRAPTFQQQSRARTVPPAQTRLATPPSTSTCLQSSPTSAAPTVAHTLPPPASSLPPPASSSSQSNPTPSPAPPPPSSLPPPASSSLQSSPILSSAPPPAPVPPPQPAPLPPPAMPPRSEPPLDSLTSADPPLPPPSTTLLTTLTIPPSPPTDTVLHPRAAEFTNQPPALDSMQQAPSSELIGEPSTLEAMRQPPGTPKCQSSTCSTDTPSGNVRFEEQSTPQLVEEALAKACPGTDIPANGSLEDEQVNAVTMAQSKDEEGDSLERSREHDEEAEQEDSKPDEKEEDLPSRQPSESGAPLVAVDTVHKQQKKVTLVDVEGSMTLVCASLDRFFDDEKMWQKVLREVAGLSARAMPSSASMPRLGVLSQASSDASPEVGHLDSKLSRSQRKAGASGYFRVQVPRPYPGVQYRKSKRLDDRYPRFAEKGSIVEGVMEEDGEWLRTNGHGYLPVRVGDSLVIVPLNPAAAAKCEASMRQLEQSWCCCTATPHVEPSWPPEDLLETQDEGEEQPDPYRRM